MPALGSEGSLNYTAAVILNDLPFSSATTTTTAAVTTLTTAPNITTLNDSTDSASNASTIFSNFLPQSLVSFAHSPPSVGNLIAASSSDALLLHDDLSSFATFDLFEDDDDLFGSPLPFDGSETGLWNGRFVPPPPRPPFFMDEPVLSDGLTTCDLCSWAMPTKSTFIFEGTIGKLRRP